MLSRALDVPSADHGYTRSHRLYERAGIFAGSGSALWLLWRLAEERSLSIGMAPAAIVLGMLEADLLSGAVHWAFDTWGTPRTRLLGPLAIRTFREHHVDPRAMLQHDFVETNGHNFALSVLLSFAGTHVQSPLAASSLLVAAVFVATTSQIHKWAHMDRPPALARALQRTRMILSPRHHDGHHAARQTRNYCITTGWLDAPLRVLRVWEILEIVVALATGARPRSQ